MIYFKIAPAGIYSSLKRRLYFCFGQCRADVGNYGYLFKGVPLIKVAVFGMFILGRPIRGNCQMFSPQMPGLGFRI